MNRECIGDLEILDTLELLNSTVEAAKWLRIAQSTCSRRYRSFSDQYSFQCDRSSSRYRVNNNLDILTDMRKAAQVFRVRQGELRYVRGWQLGPTPINSLGRLSRELPIRPMSTMEILVKLEKRLIDVAIMGVMEFQSLINTSFDKFRLSKYPLGDQLMYVPTCLYDLEVVSKNDHPLVDEREITAKQLAGYPSRGLPMGRAPMLMAQVKMHFLINEIYDHDDYIEEEWEGFVDDGMKLNYAAPFNRPDLHRIDYQLGITECLAIVGHKDVINDSSFDKYFKLLYAEINSNVVASAPKKVSLLH